jgi:serine/threonine protein kinase
LDQSATIVVEDVSVTGERTDTHTASTHTATERSPSTARQHVTAATRGPDLQPAREVFERGSLLAGRYRIVDMTHGGMARVYFAEDLDTGDCGMALRVAIKTVPTFAEWSVIRRVNAQSTIPADYARHVSRFRQEALRWTRLGLHPHIIWAMPVLDIGDKPYLVMEYADAGDLRARLRDGPLPLGIALSLALQFCEGMKHAVRTEGLVHRDIKPANVLLTKNDILKISDFGLSSVLTIDEGIDDGIHGEGWARNDSDLSVLGGGTPGYSAPEQLRSLRSATTRSDVFSFGVTFYEMLTGHRLFVGDTWTHFSAETVLSRACDVDPSIPGELSDVVSRCVEFEPSRRFASFDEISDALLPIASKVSGALPIPEDPAHLRRARLLTPSLALLSETYALLSTGRHAEAVACADRAIAIDRGNASHWINKSKAHAELGEYVAGRDAAHEATRLDASAVQGWANLGWMDLMLGDPAAGLRAANRAIGVHGGWADAWVCRSRCEWALGRPAEALESAQHATRLEPYNWKAQANFGSRLKEAGRLLDAFRSLLRAAEINPRDAGTWLELAWIHARVQSWQETDTAVGFALQCERRHATAWAIRAWVRWAEGRPLAEIERALQRSQQIDPENGHARVISEAVRKTGPIRARTGERYRGTRRRFHCGEWTISSGTLVKLEVIDRGGALATDNFGAAIIARTVPTPARADINAQFVCHACRHAFSEQVRLILNDESENSIIRCSCDSQMRLGVTKIAEGRFALLLLPFTTNARFAAIAPEIVVQAVSVPDMPGGG